MSSSKGSSSSTFTPPPEVVAAYKEALGYGRAAMGQQYQPYTGEITAPLTPTQESGIYNVNRAVGTAIPYFGQATAMTANAANTPITPQQFSQEAIQQYMSPYTKSVADATFANLREQQRQEQEGLQGQAIRAGAFGGDRAGIAAANMARQQDLATAQAMSQIYNQGYGQAVGLFGQQQGVNYGADVANAARQMQGAQQLAGLGTGLQGSVLQGAQAQLAAGAQQQAVQQAINSGYYNQYLGAQAYPYQQAQFFANLATGVGGQMGGTTTGQQAQPSPAGSIFGALGALGSIFAASDKRVKENIKPIGKTNDGQTIYRYNFKGDPTTQIGLIAQEVEKKHPEAVRSFNGVKAVDYKEATDDSVRSMGGGVVPSSTRKDFATGGPSLSDEEDPMIPYKAGVPSKVLQIPKLAKIGGSKPNFGGEPPKSPSGPSKEDFKGAAEGLGAIYDKFNSSDKKISGFENLGKDFEDMLPASAFSAAFAARGGAIGGLRPRFADGEDVPETRDSVYIPDRDRADIIRPSYNPDSDAAPIRLASLGNVDRRIDAGIPSSAPIREPDRDVNVGLVPSMARKDADLPPLFAGKETPEPSSMAVAAKQAVDSELETPEAKPVSVPSMARADANVPAVTPGLAAAKAPGRQAIPLTAQERDDAIRTIIGEAANQPYEGKLGVAQVIRNRQLAGRYGKSVSDIVYAPKQFSVWNPGDPAGKMAMAVSEDSPLYKQIGDIVDQTWSGTAEDPTKGATHFANVATVMAQRGNLQPWLQGMIDSGNTIKIGAHTFGQADAGAYSPSGEGTPSARTKTLGDIQASYKGPADEGKRTQVATAGENWPGFGVAGEGKRSIVESLVGKDLDPIQKRAMFAFFAGMAASPSPWFGQQLGAGMQAASNVYNDSMNKQAEIGIKKEQLGLEEQKIGVSERTAAVQEKAKALETLKYWLSQYTSFTDPAGNKKYRDPQGNILSQQEYDARVGQLMKEFNVVSGGASSISPKTGVAPTTPPAGVAAPEGGVVPKEKPPVSPEAGGVEKPAATTETAPIKIPEPTKVAEPAKTEEAKPAQQKAEVSFDQRMKTEKDQSKIPVDDDNPTMLRQEAQKFTDASTKAFAQGDAKSGEEYAKRATDYRTRANDIINGKTQVTFKDGNTGYIEEFQRATRAKEREQEFSKENLKTNTKWREDAGATLEQLPEYIQSLDNIAEILQVYKPNLVGDQLTKFTQLADAIGLPVTDEMMADADNFYKIMKENINLVYKRLEQIGGRVLQVEVQGLGASMPSGTLTPEAARKLTAQLKAAAEYTRQYNEDLVKNVPFGPDLGTFDRPKYIMDWKKQNPISDYMKVYDREIAARGATPNDVNRLKDGKVYILEDGQYGVFANNPRINLPEGSPIKVRYHGLKKNPQTGKMEPAFLPEK